MSHSYIGEGHSARTEQSSCRQARLQSLICFKSLVDISDRISCNLGK